MISHSPLPELPAIGFLSHMDEFHRAFLASFGSFVRPRAGATLIEEGQAQESLYLILSGLLHVVAAAGLAFMKGLLRLEAHRIRTMNAKLAESEEKSSMHSFWRPNA